MKHRKMKPKPGLAMISLVLSALLLATLACSIEIKEKSEESDSDSLKKTEMALSVQQTVIAKDLELINQQTLTAQQATIEAQNILSTQQAIQPPNIPPESQVTPMVETPIIVAPGGETPQTADFSTLMKSASILVYEDIVNYPREKHYVEDTLKGMGLTHKWDGSAKGWFKNDLLGGASGGKPWDLIILAVEARSEVTGEYFEYINDALNKGSSVIIEAWHLDQISAGTVSTILSRCGVRISNYVGKTRTPNDIIVWPLGPHPLLSTPNSGFSLTNVITYWSYDDLGDLMALTGQGDAQLVLGTTATDNTRNGTLAVCLGGQLIMQTFSSHSYPFTTMHPLWENYIHYALKVRFGIQP